MTTSELTLSRTVSETTARELQPVLTDLVALRLDAKQAHWNVIGRNFRDVHLELDELVDELDGWIDDTAERIVATGTPADARAATVAASATTPTFPDGFVRDESAVEAVATALATVAAGARPRLEALEDDLVSQDLVIEVVHGLEKRLWMLRSQLA